MRTSILLVFIALGLFSSALIAEEDNKSTSPYNLDGTGEKPPSETQILKLWMDNWNMGIGLRNLYADLFEADDGLLYFADPKIESCKKAKGGYQNLYDGYLCKYSFSVQGFYSKFNFPDKPDITKPKVREDFFAVNHGRWYSTTIWQHFSKIRDGQMSSTGSDIDDHNRRVQERIAEDIAVDVWMNP